MNCNTGYGGLAGPATLRKTSAKHGQVSSTQIALSLTMTDASASAFRLTEGDPVQTIPSQFTLVVAEAMINSNPWLLRIEAQLQ